MNALPVKMVRVIQEGEGQMEREFYQGNREKLYERMKENSILLLFSGTEVRKTADEFYPFYTDRNFLYRINFAVGTAVNREPEKVPERTGQNVYGSGAVYV